MSSKHEITLNNVPIAWDLEAGDLSFFGLQSVLFWLNPSLYRMLKPLVDVCGVELYRLLVALESSKGTEEDYHAMVTQLGETFAEGFLAWGAAVSTAGWGRFELPELDLEARTARVKVTSPWELKMQRGTEERWGCPFIQGKIIGVFTHAFGARCWADEVKTVDREDELSVELRVYADDRTLAGELERLRAEQQNARERRLQAMIDGATETLHEKLELVEHQRGVIRSMSAPLIQVWDGVLVLPLIGELDEARAEALIERTLAAVSARGAEYVIIDLTGVSLFSSAAANALLRTVAAARLLGARCLLTGLSPSVAQALVKVGTALADVPSFATVQTALETVLKLSRQ